MCRSNLNETKIGKFLLQKIKNSKLASDKISTNDFSVF